MQIQLTRKRIVNTLLIGTLALGIGSLTIQPATAQLSRSAFRETARELNLSRSQMQDVAGIMRGFSSEIQEIFTPEQLELLQSAREQQQSQTPAQDPQELREALNLTDTQSAQLAVVREEMVVDLQSVLKPYQLEGIMEMTAFSQL
ncbi:MAG: hypothetical protein AAFN40_09105 [Cyanobacteria bacterium J06560_6]